MRGREITAILKSRKEKIILFVKIITVQDKNYLDTLLSEARLF